MINFPIFLRLLAALVVILVLARPQFNSPLFEADTEGIDIMMTMDVSVSMLREDLQPNRIEAAKQVGYEFISNRKHDNIGITLFGGEAFTYCPMTTDHNTLLTMFSRVSCALQTQGILNEGTAIGMGLMNAISRLEKSSSSSKVIILMTDGANNAGNVTPITAAEVAKKKGIRIYAIAIGKQGEYKQQTGFDSNGLPYYLTMQSDMDVETLQKIAQMTGGLYYAAATNNKLRAIYQDIDKLERTKLKAEQHKKRYEAYQPFAALALCLLLIEMVLRWGYLRRLP